MYTPPIQHNPALAQELTREMYMWLSSRRGKALLENNERGAATMMRLCADVDALVTMTRTTHADPAHTAAQLTQELRADLDANITALIYARSENLASSLMKWRNTLDTIVKAIDAIPRNELAEADRDDLLMRIFSTNAHITRYQEQLRNDLALLAKMDGIDTSIISNNPPALHNPETHSDEGTHLP